MPSTLLRTILLATDGSEDAQEAERAALDLCRNTGAALHVVHAWRYPTAIYSGYTMPMSENTFALFEEGATAILDASAARIVATGGTVTGKHLCHGPAAEEIARAAREVAADLVLLGSRGLGPVRRLVLGSVSEGVVHGAPCPVLVMRGGPTAWPPTRVISGDDGSNDAVTAATIAAALAEATGAQLTLARAIPEGPGLPRPGTKQADDLIAAVEGELQERARQLVADQADQVQAVAAVDDPAALLLRLADSVPSPALIAVGSRGLRLLERLRLGSISTKVLHAAPCPVLIAPQRSE